LKVLFTALAKPDENPWVKGWDQNWECQILNPNTPPQGTNFSTLYIVNLFGSCIHSGKVEKYDA